MSEPMSSDVDDPAETDGGVVREGGGLRGRTGADTGSETNSEYPEPRVCWLDDADADGVIESLSSETARSILTALHEREQTASELAETVDTSVQNVRHHLDNLSEAGLTEVTATRYSVKGREMDVYGPPDRQTVIAVGSSRADDEASLLDSLRSILGGVAVLGCVSLLAQAAATPAGAPRVPDAVGTTPATPLPPGLLVFLGGVVAAATVLAVHRLR